VERRTGLFSRAEQGSLVRAIPGARLQTYSRTGHTPHWERPKRFVEELREFMRKGDAPPLRK
jgi:pimeloyl-ACP methyl ester carboxylesterase